MQVFVKSIKLNNYTTLNTRNREFNKGNNLTYT